MLPPKNSVYADLAVKVFWRVREDHYADGIASPIVQR